MDTSTIWLLLVVVAAVGLLAVLVILRGERTRAAEGPENRIIAASTEGATICPKCAGDNLWSDATCIHCGAKLR